MNPSTPSTNTQLTSRPRKKLQLIHMQPMMASKKLPPCFYDANGDVVISMLTTKSRADPETTDMRISSDRLRAVSSHFETNLKPEWLHNKVTGQEDYGDGTFRIMKRFELELDSDGGDFFVGKVNMPSNSTYNKL